MVYLQSPVGRVHAILPSRVIARLMDGWKILPQADAKVIKHTRKGKH